MTSLHPRTLFVIAQRLPCLLGGLVGALVFAASAKAEQPGPVAADPLVVEVPQGLVRVEPGTTWGDVLKLESKSLSRLRQAMARPVMMKPPMSSWTHAQLRVALACLEERPCVFHGAPVLRTESSSQIITPSQWEDAVMAAGVQRWGERFASLPWTSSLVKPAKLPSGSLQFSFAPGALFNAYAGEFEAEVLAMHSGKVLASRRVRWRVQSRGQSPAQPLVLSSVAWSATDTRSQAEADDLHQAPPSPAIERRAPWAVRKGMQASLRIQEGPFLAEWPVRCLSDGRVGQVIEVVRLSGGQRHRAKVIETNLLEIQ